MHAHEWMRELPQEAVKARYTYSLWAFPQDKFPRVLAAYFAFCKTYYKDHRYRCNVVSAASRLHQDRSSAVQRQLLGGRCSHWSPRPPEIGAGTISSSTSTISRPRWTARPRSTRHGAAAGTCDQGIRRPCEIVPGAAATDGSAQSAAQQLFRVPAGLRGGAEPGARSWGRRARPGISSSKTRDDFRLDALEVPNR